ncbi:glucose-1-phosphate adenylyltransferase subunit GlgD [Paenibacillus sp. IB182496]|uniref:Glucose-1-phosphate adenylyltransferase subunit GlgD n=1 Tax=Paenibacillus sabuli TaxID=2772509 RepID=A0A927BWX7_9BACL|nr:glucose-1-phosphate adenylyltransferase subunit GlgD [Paenibacillus sabuli]MBD2847250.1 glucose-1-phosphate adenylyltransferase subunit GlgD [Paenibacillus sabuli]
MSKQLMGVINLIHEPDELETLTDGRCLATVPFGARYRLIDFTLSSMVNSGISNVAVFAHTKYRSLMDHLGSGHHWDLHHRQSSLFVLPPIADDMSDLRKGDLYHFFQHRDYFMRGQAEYVVVARSHMVCNIDYEDVLRQHIETSADITVVCKRQDEHLSGRARKVRLDERGRVVSMQDHYGRLQSDLVSMEMYIMRKELLLDLVESSLAQGQDHLVRHAIMSRLDTLRIQGYLYEGYLGIINSITSYYRNSMELLKPQVWRELFFKPGPIFTKVKDEPPACYLEGAKTGNSLIANGCVIEGTVINSILFRGVKVNKGAVVRNSIVMQNGEIGIGSALDHVILDKEVHIEAGRDIRGVSDAPFIAGKRKVI